MKANLGGTDVLKVLEKVAKDSPKPGQLRQILFLTGDISSCAVTSGLCVDALTGCVNQTERCSTHQSASLLCFSRPATPEVLTS
jgi:hypothetical protein